MQVIESLFDFVKNLRAKYDAIETITAENFNVFSILRLESNEVQHSRILTELLNPKGSHQQGGKFLEAFVKSVCANVPTFESCDNVQVVAEKYVEKINNTEGGFIDICIWDGKNTIVIENKIYAGDQPAQLLRYYNSVKHSSYKKVLYLTLEGTPPSEQSIQLGDRKLEEGTHYELISYKKDIKEWLEYCLKEVALVPLVRETIHQYLNLIKKLTGQSLTHQFVEEMKEELKRNDNFTCVPSIIEAYNQLKEEAQDFFWKELRESLKNIEGFHSIISSEKKGIIVLNICKIENCDFNLKIQFGGYEIFYGVIVDEDLSISIFEGKRKKLKEICKWENDHIDWLVWKYPKDKDSFNFSEFKSDQIKSLIKEDITHIKELAKEIAEVYQKVQEIINAL